MRKALGVLAALTISGCSGQSYRVASYLNQYDFREARYEERCVSVQVAAAKAEECRAFRAKLDLFRAHASEAAKALRNGGSITLQMGQLKSDAKGLQK
jgi:hypothetical protein